MSVGYSQFPIDVKNGEVPAKSLRSIRPSDDPRLYFCAREAVAALMLFQDAARQEQLTVKAVRESARYLQEARTDSSLRFRQERPA